MDAIINEDFMEFITFIIDFILHIDVHLAELVRDYGTWSMVSYF